MKRARREADGHSPRGIHILLEGDLRKMGVRQSSPEKFKDLASRMKLCPEEGGARGRGHPPIMPTTVLVTTEPDRSGLFSPVFDSFISS